MDNFNQYIAEHVLSIGINPRHAHHREKHRAEIHDMLRNSYKEIGGYSGISSGSKKESDAIHDDITHSLIKAVKRNGKITAAMLYKDKHGRKGVATGTDGTSQGKKDFKKVAGEDQDHKRAWSEVSGAPEHLMRKSGMPIVHNKHAKALLDKDVTLDPNGEHYTRRIGDHDHRKVIVGYPKSQNPAR